MRIWILVALFSQLAWSVDCKWSEQFELGLENMQNGQFLFSALHFSTAQKSNCPSLSQKSTYNLSLAMAQLEEWREFERLTSKLSATPLHDSAKMLRAYHLQDGATPLNPDERIKLELWNARHDGVEFRTQLKRSAFSSNQKMESSLARVHRRSPGVAAALSAVLPGAGYAYAGAWQTAGLSFILNAVFISAALDFNRHGLHQAEIAAFSVASVTYLGGILGSYKVTKAYNAEQMRAFNEDWADILFPELTPRP